MSKNTATPVKLSTMTSGTEATIMLYGMIGEDMYSMQSEGERQNTAKEFVNALNSIDGKYEKINIRINSSGGSMYEGNAMITAIRNAKSEIHGYNDGLCASMAADIWLACPNRHMATNALLMIHEAIGATYGNATKHIEAAKTLDKWSDTAINVMAEVTGLSKEQIKQDYYNGKDHWLSFDDAVSNGLVQNCGCSNCDCDEKKDPAMAKPDEEKEPMMASQSYSSEAKFPAGIQKMKYQDAVKALAMKRADVVLMAPEIDTQTETITNQEQEMTIETIKAAIEAGTLDKEQLLAELAPVAQEEQAQTEQKPDPTPEPTPTANDQGEILKLVQLQADAITALQAKIDKISAAPGDGQTFGTLPEKAEGIEVTQGTDVLEAYRRELNSGAARFVPG